MKETLDLDEDCILVKFKGEEYRVLFPSLLQATKYQEVMKNVKEDKAADLLLGLLDDLGLPKKVAENMPFNGVLKIIEKLMPAKKK